MKKFALALALFALPVFAFADSNVVTSHDAGSVINPSVSTVLTGDVQVFSIQSVGSNAIEDVTINGVSQGPVSSIGITGDADMVTIDPITLLPVFTPDTQTISVSSRPTGGTMPYCSGPTAPGWNVSLPGGGCGGTEDYVQYNHLLPDGTLCEFQSGCMVPLKQ